MKPLALVFVLAFALVVVNGRNLSEDTGENAFFSEDSDTPVENFDDPAYFDESYENDQDETFALADESIGNLDLNYDTYSLMGCGGGKCEFCFKLWKMKGCLIVKLTSKGVKLEFEAFGKRLYSKTLETNGSFTLKVSTSKFPKWARKYVRSLEIKSKKEKKVAYLQQIITSIQNEFSKVDLKERSLCMQLIVKLKFGGSFKWPKNSPQCFTL